MYKEAPRAQGPPEACSPRPGNHYPSPGAPGFGSLLCKTLCWRPLSGSCLKPYVHGESHHTATNPSEKATHKSQSCGPKEQSMKGVLSERLLRQDRSGVPRCHWAKRKGLSQSLDQAPAWCRAAVSSAQVPSQELIKESSVQLSMRRTARVSSTFPSGS